jgi:hypothetical protein
MNAVHRNHEALMAVAQPREEMVRLELRTVNGLWFIPSASGHLALRYVPANVSGLCNATFFDKQGRETRTNVTIRLPGDSVGKLPSSSSDQPLLEAGRQAAESDRAAAEAEEGNADAEEVGDSTDVDSSDGTEEPDSDDAGNDESALNVLRRRESPEVEVLEREELLYSDLTAARQAQIRTAVSTHEEAMGIQIEAEKLRIIRGHSYTREIGENHQLMTMMRRDLAAMLATMRDVGRNQVVSSEAAGNAMLRMARKVAKQLRDPDFAKPAPPPPPPDYAGVAIALLNTVGRIGSAWAPGRKRSAAKKKDLLKLLTEAQGPIATGDADGLKALLESFAKVEAGAAAKPGEKTEAKPKTATGKGASSSSPPLTGSLAELIDSGQLKEILESGKLKQLIESGQLELLLRTLGGDK